MRIAVVGSGTMGHGIAEVASISGMEVKLIDISWDILNRAKQRMEESLKRLYDRGTIKESPEQVMRRIEMSTSYEVAKEVDFAIEAVPEILDLKRKVFEQLDKITPRDAVLATNTSSIPISDIGEITSRKERVIGMHFFNPPPLMKLVEVIPSKYTTEEVTNFTVDLAKKMGKVPVRLKVEVPGFVSNRIFLRLLQEACREVESGEATVEEVDSAARNKLKLPMGIFELADYVGLDVVVDLWKVIVGRGAKDVSCSSYNKKVESKELGVKAGKGFYSYQAPGKYSKVPLPQDSRVPPERVISLAVNEGAWLMENGIVNAEEIDTVMKLGFNFPKGLMEIADELGIDSIVSQLKDIYSKGYDAYMPNPLLLKMVSSNQLGKSTGRGFYVHNT
ncbi:3-hydroxyacyl-CoA dehydrogenase [Metallosphaera tengchongensis]|uniref:3-hydroxyacyl-CoA dehydrogenase n=1 Tax=Metallosphaera tengchongensis TaxID=1532350 RepID=A0A6N0NV39_9CREN|nr:3-hydroxyacyl-CoA dehydrogenase [Metallosphaera tengchongensis]QKQ99578.1 3-hydroxyacyl-CoA dehydrogenase [Metallosphaera tengchongensis]